MCMKKGLSSPNGPPLLGRLEMLTRMLTPVPLVAELATTEPLAAHVLGSTAMNCAPCGLLFTTGAVPRVPGTSAANMLKADISCRRMMCTVAW